ncbi:MAG: ctpI, partial [Frankiales bacterium]|nr:ctpI [Frankiales bacterium]
MLLGLLRSALERAAPAPARTSLSPDHPSHPVALLRETSLAALSLAGVGVAVAGRVVRARPLPIVLPILTALVDATPPARGVLERYAGRPLTDGLLGVAGTTTQSLAQRPLGLVVELVHRLALAAEIRAERRAWERFTATLPPVEDWPGPPDAGERPGALHTGPLERYVAVAVPTALAGTGLAFALTRRPERALGLLSAGISRSGLLAREAFAAQLGRTCAAHDVVVMDRRALRRLDRIDTVLLDASALLTGDRLVDEVLVLAPEVSPDEVHRQVYGLVALDDLQARHVGPDGWSVQPVHQLPAPPAELAVPAGEHAGRGGVPLVLLHGDQVVALVVVADELDPLAEALVEAAGHGSRVVVAEDGHRLAARLGVQDAIAGGAQLLEGVRSLQRDGQGVALVAARPGTALAAADVGIGVQRGPSAVPWGAHLLCRRGTVDAHLLLEAVPIAHRVSSRAVTLAMLSAATSGLLAAFGRREAATARALLPTTMAGAVGLLGGTWYAAVLGARPPPVESDRTPWHAMPVDAALRLLRSSPDGLAESEAHRRGTELPDVQPTTGRWARATAEELANPITAALAASAGASLLVGATLDAGLITAVLAGNALIGGAQRLGTDRALRSLVDASAIRVRLWREGLQRVITADQLVVGDVVELHAGDAVPADCRVLQARALEVDESSVTGESLPVDKTEQATPAAAVADRRCMLYDGSVVAAGSGRAVVVALGGASQLGRTVRAVARAPLP